jgi:radical SAM superfamily enzyme YgiQ (UPF0313 family)
MPCALLVNPWIYDFAAYDLWAQPLGLLNLGAILRLAGWDVELIDMTNRFHPSIETAEAGEFHTGKYFAEEIPKPAALAALPRRYKRYGVPPDAVRADLAAMEKPDVILVTSRMTYWYGGVADAIALCREVFAGVPVLLGGIYATLCPEHARRVCRPDHLFQGDAEAALPSLVEQVSCLPVKLPGDAWDFRQLDQLPFPAYDLLPHTRALAVETSRGCPYRCTYCSTPVLNPRLRRRSPENAIALLERAITEFGTGDFAFYDDALLVDAGRHFLPIARGFVRRGLEARFHAPNSLFASMITPQVADAMMAMGFETIRISLESASTERLSAWNRRHVLPDHFEPAMAALRGAGFRPDQIGVYILCAAPGQGIEEVQNAIRFVREHGGTPRLAEYSPIPGTPEYELARAASGLPLDDEPLFHNNTIYPWASGNLSAQELSSLKGATAI